MKVSTKGRYALRLMIDIALHSGGEAVSLKEISERQEISVKYLEQIVSTLCKVGFLKSLRGSQGGYKLAKDSKDYTVGSILRITEGNLAPTACLEDEINECPHYDHCSTIEFWEGLNKVINQYVDSVTLFDLVEKQRKKEGNSI